MAIPNVKDEKRLQEDEWLEVERTKMSLRHRLEQKRERNEIYKRGRALQEAGHVLSIEPRKQVKNDA